MKDLAAFKNLTIINIFGRARCRFCGSYEIQGHHVTGRGNMKDDHDRELHSSPFNYCPLCNNCHTFAPVNEHEIVTFFLRKASEAVYYAVAIGKYEITATDQEFLQKYQTI